MARSEASTEGRTTMTAKVLAQRLTETSEAYHSSKISHEEFTAQQRANWDHIHSLHREEEVLELLRSRYSIAEVRS
jgi:hypothetical protein